MKFEDLNRRFLEDCVGWQWTGFFDNGYGVSVVRHKFSYGNTNGEGLFELAVVKGTEDKWNLCYDTTITSDVIGYLTEADVTKLLGEVEAL